MDSQTFTYDAAQALNENTFTKPGYTFVEWNTEADGSGTAYADKEEASNLATEGTVNLYAQWEANPFLLIYHSNYNVEGMKETTSQSPQWKTDDYETLKHIESAGFAKLGYTFAGWNTKADGSGKLFTETGSAHKVQFTAADIDENDEAHLYAQWAANTYTVEFNGNGETSGEMPDQTFTYDRAQDLPKNAFAKAGYTFAGWSTVKNGDVVYTDGQEVNNLSAVNGDVITLYAKWTANTYTVKFDGNGATSGTMDDQTFIYDEAKNLTKNAFAKTGYTFAGWSTTEDGSVAYKDGAKVKNLSAVNDDEIILYAQWKADPIEVDIGQYVYKQYVQKYNRADTSGATFTFEAEIDQVTANSGSTAVYAAAPLDLPINLTGTATLSTGETKNVTFTVNGTDSKTVTLDGGLYRTSGCTKQAIVLYEYQSTRKAEHAEHFLQGFSGWLHADGYQGYHKLPGNIRVVGCWAHARRKFDEALQTLPKEMQKDSPAAIGECYCSRLFKLEQAFAELTPEERYEKRLEQEKPVLDALLSWANEMQAKTAPKSALGRAIHYLLEQWPYLTRYLEDGRLELSNNRAERSIKPFVMGRKNWLFANTPGGAQASAVIYSLIETAKENGLDPYRYLLWVLQNAPQLSETDETWPEKLLPANAPEECCMPQK